jgi:hypothetical protein
VRLRLRRKREHELEQALRRSPAELGEWIETGRIRPGNSPTGDQGKIAKRISKLPVRQRYVLELMAEGRTDEDIAPAMWISRLRSSPIVSISSSYSVRSRRLGRSHEFCKARWRLRSLRHVPAPRTELSAARAEHQDLDYAVVIEVASTVGPPPCR